MFFRFNQATSGDTYRVNSTTLYPTTGTTWIHIAGTYDGTTMRLYVNGVQESSLAASIAIATNNLGLGIGAQADGVSKFMGQMDDVRIYHRALSASEIAALATVVTHTITASAGPNGNISPSGAVTVAGRWQPGLHDHSGRRVRGGGRAGGRRIGGRSDQLHVHQRGL